MAFAVGRTGLYKQIVFYPSIGASVIVSEMIPNLSKDYISFLKVRASYASVGNAFKRFVANPVLEWNNTSSTFEQLTNYPVSNLKPERTKSWEFGLTVNFLKYFNADLSYYLTNTYDQLFQPDISVGSGYSTIYVQTGNIRNQGVELALGFKNTWRKFTWNSNLTFSTNNNKIIELGNNLVNPVTGELFSISSLDMKGLGDVHFLLKEGGHWAICTLPQTLYVMIMVTFMWIPKVRLSMKKVSKNQRIGKSWEVCCLKEIWRGVTVLI